MGKRETFPTIHGLVRDINHNYIEVEEEIRRLMRIQKRPLIDAYHQKGKSEKYHGF